MKIFGQNSIVMQHSSLECIHRSRHRKQPPSAFELFDELMIDGCASVSLIFIPSQRKSSLPSMLLVASSSKGRTSCIWHDLPWPCAKTSYLAIKTWHESFDLTPPCPCHSFFIFALFGLFSVWRSGCNFQA